MNQPNIFNRFLLCALSGLFVFGLSGSIFAQENGVEFDHFETGYPLDGLHQNIACGDCHVSGVFLGTPRQCELCHSSRAAISGSIKPTNHIATTDLCSDCHSPTGWDVIVRTEHSSMIGSCTSCHNNVTATGMGANHILSTNLCENCHSSNSWEATILVDHNEVLGSCGSCHDGAIAPGKPGDHLITTGECDQCHITAAWIPAIGFDHTGISAGCSTCHDNTTATGKGPTHISSTNSCESCHAPPIGWSPAALVDHNEVLGSCSSCHNGVTATGTPSGHFMVTTPSINCDSCHSSVGWTPNFYTHSGAYPGDHRDNLSCDACHTTDTEMIPWLYPAHQPDCAACHENEYRPGPHKKSESPEIFYTVGELKDCTGACHEAPGEHSVNDEEF